MRCVTDSFCCEISGVGTFYWIEGRKIPLYSEFQIAWGAAESSATKVCLTGNIRVSSSTMFDVNEGSADLTKLKLPYCSSVALISERIKDNQVFR